MKKRTWNIGSAFLASLLGLTLLSGCAANEKPAAPNVSTESSESVPGMADNADNPSGLSAASQSLGEFSLEDIEGTAYTQDVFKDYSLTMINIFTTWCSPCINEIPDLEQLRQDMADKGVNVLGIVLDAADGMGGTDETAIESAKLLAEKTGAAYPFLVPDQSLLNGRLTGIDAVPETFFVDQEGNIVGETYSGSHSLEDWTDIVESTLEALK